MTAQTNRFREANGRFVQVACTDPNCSGDLVPDSFHGHAIYRCNGLTHAEHPAAALVACERMIDPPMSPRLA